MFNTNQVVFIDSQIQDADKLIAGLSPNTSIYRLSAGRDGVAQISEILEQHRNLEAVHIVSHGSEGSLQLGSSTLSIDTLDRYRQDLTGWSNALSKGGDLLFFGCNVAQGEHGQAFIQQLDALTGADIAASTDLTGNASLGGDWTLEAFTGSIEAQTPFAADSVTNYPGVLASLIGNISGTQTYSEAVNVSGNLSLSGDVILNVDDFTLGENFKISGDGVGPRDNLTINSDGKVTIAGDILGGGINNITINARDIEIQGTSFISTRLINDSSFNPRVYETAESIGNSGNLSLGVAYTFRNFKDGAARARDGGILGNANPTIEITSGAKLLTHVGAGDTETAGDISITALDETLQTQLLSFPTQPLRAATINIDRATLKGKDVTVSAKGIDPKLFGEVLKFQGQSFVDRTLINPFLEGSASLLQNFILPASVEVRISKADATVTGSTIDASGNVTIETQATADASVRAHRNIYTSNPNNSNAVKTAKLTTHVSVGVGYAETDAVTNVKGSSIKAGGNVSITSDIGAAAAVTARLFGNLQFGGQGASANNYGVVGAVSVTDTTSKVLLDQNSSIDSGGNVAIRAGGRVDGGARAVNRIFTTGNLAASVAVNHDKTNIDAIVHGDITAAGRVTQDSNHTVINRDQINGQADTLSFTQGHNFKQGSVIYLQLILTSYVQQILLRIFHREI